MMVPHSAVLAAGSAVAPRSQMGFSLGWHIILACLGVGLPGLILFIEWRGHRTGETAYRLLARRWARAMGVLFAIGAVSGTMWVPKSRPRTVTWPLVSDLERSWRSNRTRSRIEASYLYVFKTCVESLVRFRRIPSSQHLTEFSNPTTASGSTRTATEFLRKSSRNRSINRRNPPKGIQAI
jgi:hypothetical protein